MTVDEAYEDLQIIITRGFLTVGVSCDSTYFVFKNLTDKESDSLFLYVSDDSINDVLYTKLAFCTYSIDGLCILTGRRDDLPSLKAFYSAIPNSLLDRMVKCIGELSKRYVESVQFLEGFCYTGISRNLWKIWSTVGGTAYVSGPGYDSVGINAVQENWVLINRNMDQEEQYEHDYDNALFIASAFAGKGASLAAKSMEARRRERDEMRQEIAKYGYDKRRQAEIEKRDLWTAPIVTREDLVRELYKQMRGEKDKHDLFMDAWFEQEKRKAEEAKIAAEERQKEFRKHFDELDMSMLEPSRPVTLEEIRKVQEAQKNKPTTYMSSDEVHDRKQRFIEKIGSHVIRAPSKG